MTENSTERIATGGTPGMGILTNNLDDIERKIESFRQKAQELERERECLLAGLQSIQSQAATVCENEITEGEKEELYANTERLIYRCLTVDITVHTVRTPGQEAALGRIQQCITDLDQILATDCEDKGKRTLHSYLNACLPEETVGPMDQKFQGTLLQCTADDQKKIRQMLQSRSDELTIPVEQAESFLSRDSQSNGCYDSSNNSGSI